MRGDRERLGDARFFYLEERTRLEESRERGLERDDVNDRAIGFREAVEGLEKKLFIINRVADIGQIVCGLLGL